MGTLADGEAGDGADDAGDGVDVGGDGVADGGEVGGFDDDDDVVGAGDDVDGCDAGDPVEGADNVFGFADGGFYEYEGSGCCHGVVLVVAGPLVRAGAGGDDMRRWG